MENLNQQFVIKTMVATSLAAIIYFYFRIKKSNTNKSSKTPEQKKVPISVNYHFSRKCNYECGFCFHTAKTSYVLTLEQAKEGLSKLRDAGMKKINFAGGEPFLYPKFLGELIMFCKQSLKLESVSIISNGSLIKENWMEKYAKYLDILGISCDSFDESINVKIGRGTGKHIENIFKVRNMCYEYNIKFKLNTVVCRYNFMEDMNSFIERLQPFRWKCFQVLIVKTENDGNEASIRNAQNFTITDEEYEQFCQRHQKQASFIKESNTIMRSSYLILDEYMRFLDKGDKNEYIISDSILDVSVDVALGQINWDDASFQKRNGQYDWTKEFSNECLTDKNLDW